jgi:hypothetical protein
MRFAVLTKSPLNPTSPDECATGIDQHEPAYRGGAAFVLMRLCLQEYIRNLREACEQGLALDMAMAAANLEIAAYALAAHVRDLLAREASMDIHIQSILYECRALHDTIADLFAACLPPASPSAQLRKPQELPPTEKYPWLHACLTHYATQVDHAFSTCGSVTGR